MLGLDLKVRSFFFDFVVGPKSALEPKAAGAVTLTWPMYLPVVEVGGRIMRDGRDVMVPRPSTVCIAGVVQGGMG